MHHSALFWRIAACLFASILLIEGMLLAYSWVTERERMISRLDESMQSLVSSLDTTDPVPQLNRLTGNPALNSEIRILGFLHTASDGTVSKGGIIDDTEFAALQPGQRVYDRPTDTMVTQQRRTLRNGQSDTISLLINASSIATYMSSYVWRILGMVMLISVFLTMACLFFLKPMLIDPLRRLEKLLTFKRDTGINDSKALQKDIDRPDELGAVFRSFTELREQVIDAETKLEHLANHDELTGLANRRKMNEFLEASLDSYKTDKQTCSILMLDLDYFKEVNDTAGHAAGDALLTSIACIMRDCVNERSLVTRLGGDEFAIILPGIDLDNAISIAENVRESIDEMGFVWEQQQFSVSVSIGIAEVTAELCSKEALIMAADNGCIEAKQRGKNQIVTYESLMKSHIADEAIWINRILESLDSDRFTLFRQSIVRINAQQPCEHFEILLRMENPEGGHYSPADFLPVAERHDLMPKIDRWVIDNAYQWLSTQEIESRNDYCMNINISANSLSNPEFRDYLENKVKHSTEINSLVCFEMTETAAMTSFDQTVALLNSIKEQGCKVALDDFGTGFSSLSHIRELPLDYIKIDGSFVQQISSNELDQTVVKSVAEIAKVLRIKTVAEFVDNEAALKVLEKLQIDYAQGFLFSQPKELVQQAIHVRNNRAA